MSRISEFLTNLLFGDQVGLGDTHNSSRISRRLQFSDSGFDVDALLKASVWRACVGMHHNQNPIRSSIARKVSHGSSHVQTRHKPHPSGFSFGTFNSTIYH